MTGRSKSTLPKRDSSKDAPLVEDIRLLGQILGTTIRKEFGAPDEMKLRTAMSLKLSYKKSYYAVFGAFARVRSFRN